MGDIYISGNGKRPQDTQDIPITPQQSRYKRPRCAEQKTQQRHSVGDSSPTRAANSADLIRNSSLSAQARRSPGEEPARKKPKKKSRAARALFIVLLVLVLIASSIFGVVYATASKIDYKPETLKENVYVDSSTLMHDSKVTNILLIGVDGSSSDTSLRSDTMLMMSIRPQQ